MHQDNLKRVTHHASLNPIDATEQDRVAFLRSLNILDSEPSLTFDRITEAASTITHAPIALVSLMDSDRQWFMSKVGTEVSETRRDHAICTHLVCQSNGQMFVVRDVLQDDRFKHSELVLGKPQIRFYAGVPLVVDDNNGCKHIIGALCIIDWVPRTLEGYHQLVLETLAQLVVTEIYKMCGMIGMHADSLPYEVYLHSDCCSQPDNWFGTMQGCPQVSGGEHLLTYAEAEAMWKEMVRQSRNCRVHRTRQSLSYDADWDDDSETTDDSGDDGWGVDMDCGL